MVYTNCENALEASSCHELPVIGHRLLCLGNLFLAKPFRRDYPSAPLGEKEQALFRFADKLTRKPSDVEGSDIDALRQAGWDENVLLDVVLTISWFSFINRVSFGLGLFGEP